MRNLIGVALSLILATTSAMAGSNSLPLAPGKPAGVKHAQVDTTGVVLMLGIAGIIMGVAFSTASSGNPGQPVTPTPIPTTNTG